MAVVVQPCSAIFGEARRYLFFVSAIFLSACQASNVRLSPPLRVQVFDASTGKPVQGVAVRLWSSTNKQAYETALSDQDGVVILPPLRGDLGVAFPFVMDPYIGPAIVRFDAKGYLAREISQATDPSLFNGSKAVLLSHESQK
jgi:5-hydroxyisourate hydrolase-like protein (transthyretin family)